MLNKLLILIIPFSFVFSQNNQSNIDLRTKTQTSSKTDIRYKIPYVQATGIVIFFDVYDKPVIPAIGLGYRTHKKQHGFDISLNVWYDFEPRFPFIPYLKIFYLNYPMYLRNIFFIGDLVFLIPHQEYPFPLLL